jgi:hypothetical protein
MQITERRAAQHWLLSMAVAGALFLSGCAGDSTNYGVLLWNARDYPFDAGTVVRYQPPPVASQVLTVTAVESEARASVERGFIKVFETVEEAKEFRNRYRNFRDMFAVPGTARVSVRAEPSSESELRTTVSSEERLKVVQRVGTEEEINGQSGHWYEVVSPDGTAGYAFSAALEFPHRQESTAVETSGPGTSPSLTEFYESTWRPAYMAEMVQADRVNLRRFDPNIGLFPSRDRITIDTGKTRLHFPADDPQPIGNEVYSFSDGDLQVSFEPGTEVVVRYVHRGTAVRERYVQLGVDMERIIEEERQRRKRMYRSLLEVGRTFRSEHYGALFFREDRRVRWTDRDVLVPRLIPSDAGEVARARLNVFLGENLSERYTGAMTLSFDLAERDTELAFLYRLLDNGIQLTVVPVEHVRDDVIQSIPSSPTIMYFEHTRERPSGDTASSADKP